MNANLAAKAALMLGAVARIVRNVSIPVTADMEAGYDLSPAEFVAQLLDAGAVGCNVEDADHDAGRGSFPPSSTLTGRGP